MVATQAGGYSFAIEPRRVLVALTRACLFAIVIGDAGHRAQSSRLGRYDKFYAALREARRIHEMS